MEPSHEYNPAPVINPQTNGAQPAPGATSGLTVAGFILAFFIPIVGFVMSIVALSNIKKNNEGGRGLAVAGIIISSLVMVLSALVFAALVFTSFKGTQEKVGDVERQVDIKAIHAHVESYYAQHGYYPSLAQMNDSAFRQTNMKDFDEAALRDPKGTSDVLVSSPSKGAYAYQTNPVSCTNEDNESLNSTTACVSYVLSATLEGQMDGTNVFSKRSLNPARY